MGLVTHNYIIKLLPTRTQSFHLLTHCTHLTYFLTHLLTYSLTHLLTYSLTHFLTHSLTYLLTHSLTNLLALLYIGPIGWTLPPEIYPLELRGRAMALTTFTNWTCAFTVGILTPILLSSAGTNGTFFMLSVSLFLGFLYVWLFVPETKQKSLEDMEMLFRVQSRRELARFVHDRFHEGLKCH